MKFTLSAKSQYKVSALGVRSIELPQDWSGRPFPPNGISYRFF